MKRQYGYTYNVSYWVVQNDNNHTMDFVNIQIVNETVRSRQFLEAYYSTFNAKSFYWRMNFYDYNVPSLQDSIGKSNWS